MTDDITKSKRITDLIEKYEKRNREITAELNDVKTDLENLLNDW